MRLFWVLDVELDEPSDVNLRDAGEAQCGQGPLDGDALRVEDPRLGPDQDAGPHAAARTAVRSSQAWKGSPVMRS